jgi:SPP1 family predicted phage head-tail adaptor
MTKNTTAGDLHERVGFGSHGSGSDSAGGTISAFTEQFTRRAAYIHMRGGEAVMAARLEGRHTQVIRVRADSQTRAVTSDWQIADKNSSAVFNIRDITPTTDRKWIDFLCETGVAT